MSVQYFYNIIKYCLDCVNVNLMPYKQRKLQILDDAYARFSNDDGSWKRVISVGGGELQVE
jgi:hypothetical protein